MKFRNLPSIVALISALVTCIILLLNDFTIVQSLWIIILVIIIFYIIGIISRIILNIAFRETPQITEDIEESDSDFNSFN